MSQQIPSVSAPTERNIYVKCNNMLGRVNKVRSGILERYTYKSDNGKLLNSAPANSDCNSKNIKSPKMTIIKTNANKTLERSLQVHQSVSVFKVGNSSRNNEVRTEHCDSTTDIIENMEKETVMLFSNEYYTKFQPPQQSYEEDSDSDCQIIDVNSEKSHASSNINRYPVSQDEILTHNTDKANVIIGNLSNIEESPNSKVLSWISSKIDDPIHVISDSEEECETFLCDKTGVKINNDSSFNRILPDITLSKVPMKAKYNCPGKRISSNFTDLSHTVTKVGTPEMCTVPELLSKSIFNRFEATPPKSQNSQIQMSPETMKSEFYSYLKINTNPLAQKAETVAQNRRSVRVRNIISQIKKDRELKNNVSPEKDRNEVRKRFMKYSKPNVVSIFPPPSIQHNKISDFNHYIENYFLEENIKYKTDLNDETTENRKVNKPKKKLVPKKDNSSFVIDKKMRRLRFGPNRINTSVRITRNSLDGCRMWNTKLRKRAKINKVKKKILEPTLPKVADSEKKTYCRNTPIYNSEPEKELEFFTSSSQDTKVQQNGKKGRRKSSPFLGFTSDEKTQHNFISTVSTTKPVPELQENIHLNFQLADVISLSSENNTAEDSNSEHSSVVPTNIQEVIDIDLIESGNPNYIPLNQNIKPKSFHKSLTQTCVKRKSTGDITRGLFELSDSDSSMSTPKTLKGKKSQTHEIDINKNNGAVFNTYYVNEILIIVQELLITFWKQTALGNILGAQNMWVPHGSIQRIILEPGCVNRRSSEMVLSCENSVSYIELWTKEHKCRFRECPIADVFATVYFHKGHGTPDKKVLQLENIKGYGNDVRFAVIKNSREIIVSWCDTFSKPIKTLVRCYQLASDFQTVSSVKEMEFVSHYISSLHNIHDCDDLVLGAGNEQISVWNLRHGYLVTTMKLSESPIETLLENKTICLYAQCDTGFLFLIQQTEVGILRLVAVNGMTQEWKQLHSYQVPDNYKKLLGVIVESGVLMTCYTNGFLCWNMQSGEVLAEIDTPNELIVLPSNKYMVAIDNYQVTVQHIMSYILTHDW